MNLKKLTLWLRQLFQRRKPPEIVRCCLTCKFFERRTDGVYQCSRGVIDHADPYHENKDKFSCSHYKSN